MGGTISVNAGNPADNNNGYIGGLIGLNEGYVTRSYTTIDNITAQAEGTGGSTVDKYTGFTTMGTDFTPEEGGVIENNFAALPDPNSGVSQFANQWPSWPLYTGDWPVESTGWLSGPSNSFWYSNGSSPDNYPLLQWERK